LVVGEYGHVEYVEVPTAGASVEDRQAEKGASIAGCGEGGAGRSSA